ncbi:DUF599 domain-containing protein [Sulfuriferula thiophila]|uniref:DUF599 domain-containing protein n=1 Tax=Sulfuriferula thiophila TaxID=1781211 RepID=UPI001CB91616|nr:DUF599 domain-containing protein [Sulfuriferula thiophila]
MLFCTAILGLYHLYLAYKVKKRPTYTIQAVNRIARTAWVETIMAERRDILAVQTLRNSTMAATFLASTAVLLIIGVLTLSGQGANLSNTWHALNMVGATHDSMWLAKLMLLLSDLFVAFFCFSMSIRMFNHVGFMINVPLALNHKMISPRHVALHLNRAGKFYSIGMRAYYFSVPMVFWLFGPHFMVASTILLIFVLYFLDRAPKVMAEDYAE